MSFECCSFSDLHYQGDQTLSITTTLPPALYQHPLRVCGTLVAARYQSSKQWWPIIHKCITNGSNDNGEGETVVIRPSPNDVEDMITRPPKE
ncbi:BnaC08g47830D [Brassica napus]|uniref:BnaC08g47830D protein n=1 Tax=Brassica napus TaxID=3708 RepID=A0A078ITP0_BRANA|nr:BnaC08g47830D [Brassica napus]